jgi:hypothetical protein
VISESFEALAVTALPVRVAWAKRASPNQGGTKLSKLPHSKVSLSAQGGEQRRSKYRQSR